LHLIKVSCLVLFLFGITTGLLIINSPKAHASVVSFFAGILSGNQVSGHTGPEKYNSQNLALLDASQVQKVGTGGGEVVIVDNTALEFQTEISSSAYQSDQISTYVVRPGDTLSQIAKMFNVSVNTIVWANDIEGGVITPGQNLVILPVSGVRHLVKEGETLESIAKKHGGDLREILQFNNLTFDAKIAVGEEIIIPNGDATPVTPEGKPKSTPAKQTSLAGYFAKPVDGPYTRSQGIHGYNGVDLAGAVGTNIVASASGKVIVSRNAGFNGGYGNYIVISHPNGTQTLYAHLKSTAIAQGANVSKGQLIGYMGNTGRSTGPHLHFEVRGAKNPF
jgi:LysM repeat protein